jgi:hypothetical protein
VIPRQEALLNGAMAHSWTTTTMGHHNPVVTAVSILNDIIADYGKKRIVQITNHLSASISIE